MVRCGDPLQCRQRANPAPGTAQQLPRTPRTRLRGVGRQVGLQHRHRALRLPAAVVQAGQGLGNLAMVWPRGLHLRRGSMPGTHRRDGRRRRGLQRPALQAPVAAPQAPHPTPHTPAPGLRWLCGSPPCQRTAWRGRTAHPGHLDPAAGPAGQYCMVQGAWVGEGVGDANLLCAMQHPRQRSPTTPLPAPACV